MFDNLKIMKRIVVQLSNTSLKQKNLTELNDTCALREKKREVYATSNIITLIINLHC